MRFAEGSESSPEGDRSGERWAEVFPGEDGHGSNLPGEASQGNRGNLLLGESLRKFSKRAARESFRHQPDFSPESDRANEHVSPWISARDQACEEIPPILRDGTSSPWSSGSFGEEDMSQKEVAEDAWVKFCKVLPRERIAAIRILRETTGMGLKFSSELFDSIRFLQEKLDRQDEL